MVVSSPKILCRPEAAVMWRGKEIKKYVMAADVETSSFGPKVPRLFSVSSSLANTKSEAESQRDGARPKMSPVASPEKEK